MSHFCDLSHPEVSSVTASARKLSRSNRHVLNCCFSASHSKLQFIIHLLTFSSVLLRSSPLEIPFKCNVRPCHWFASPVLLKIRCFFPPTLCMYLLQKERIVFKNLSVTRKESFSSVRCWT